MEDFNNSNDIDFYIDKLNQLFFSDKTDLYLDEFLSIENKIIKNEITYSSKSENLKSAEEILKYFKSIPVINQISDDFNLVNRCKELQDYTEITPPHSVYKDIKTWFKHENDFSSITICGGSYIECDLFQLLAVLSEIDLMKDYISQFEDISKLSELTPLRWLLHVKIKMPMTFTNRDIVCSGFGVINKEKQNIMMPFKSVREMINSVVPTETSKYKRLDVHFGYYNIKYVSENKYYLTCGFNVDPKIPIIPWFILNSFIKKSTYYIVDGLKTQIYNEKAKGIYKIRVQEKKDYYEKVKESLENLKN